MLARLGARLGQVILRSGKSFGRLATFGAGIAVGTEADSLKKHGPYEVVIKRRSGALPPAAAPEASSAAASSWGWSRSAVAGVLAGAGLLAAGGVLAVRWRWRHLEQRRQQEQQEQQSAAAQLLGIKGAGQQWQQVESPCSVDADAWADQLSECSRRALGLLPPGEGSVQLVSSASALEGGPRTPVSWAPSQAGAGSGALTGARSSVMLSGSESSSPFIAARVAAVAAMPLSQQLRSMRSSTQKDDGQDSISFSVSQPISAQSSLTSCPELLLSRLNSAESFVDTCIIDPASIEFVRKPDGSLVELGRGAFSTVLRGLLDGVQPCAIKVLQLGDDPKLQDDFLREASLLRQLHHRNIVGFSGVCVAEGCGFILQEWMEGGDLMQRLQATNKAGQRLLGWYSRGRSILLDIARGLHYLHRHNLTHFDLKSSNVLLSRDLTVAKLGDVGFAKALQRTHFSSASTAGRGTFTYMAPELLVGDRCSASVDIYSFGVLLQEVCSGVHPKRGALAPLRVPEDCPQEVADLFAECMSLDPSRRPTAKELVERLVELQDSPPPPPPPEA